MQERLVTSYVVYMRGGAHEIMETVVFQNDAEHDNCLQAGWLA